MAMFPSIERLLRELQDYNACIDVDLDIGDRRRFLLHVHQRERVLDKLHRMCQAAEPVVVDPRTTR